MSAAHKHARGFTLLEVLVALTITGFVLGGLFSLVGGSKQLSWKSQESLVRAVNTRAQINFSLLEDEYSDVEPILEVQRYRVLPLDILAAPERKTQASSFALEEFEIIDEEREQSIIGTRWLRLELSL